MRFSIGHAKKIRIKRIFFIASLSREGDRRRRWKEFWLPLKGKRSPPVTDEVSFHLLPPPDLGADNARAV